jgi:hypothetical protein
MNSVQLQELPGAANYCLGPESPNFLPLRFGLVALFFFAFFFAMTDLPPFVGANSGQTNDESASTLREGVPWETNSFLYRLPMGRYQRLRQDKDVQT